MLWLVVVCHHLHQESSLGHSVLPQTPQVLQGRPMPWRNSYLLLTDFWGCVSAEMAETPLQRCSPEVQQHNSVPKPLLPSTISSSPSTVVGAQPQAHPPTNARITWSQKGGWSLGTPFWLPQYLLFCFPPVSLPTPLLLSWMHKSGSWNYFLLPLYLLCILL